MISLCFVYVHFTLATLILFHFERSQPLVRSYRPAICWLDPNISHWLVFNIKYSMFNHSISFNWTAFKAKILIPSMLHNHRKANNLQERSQFSCLKSPIPWNIQKCDVM